MILDLKLVILQYSRRKKDIMTWKIIRHPCHKIYYAAQGIATIVQKLSNKQSAKVICRFDRLRTSHSKRHQNHLSFEKLVSSAYAFNCIALRVNHGLTSCKDLATALVQVGGRNRNLVNSVYI